MKKLRGVLLSAICLIIIGNASLKAQEKTAFQKKIAVQGSAEMEIIPDEIYFSVTLKEYEKDRKKIDISQLELQLARAVKKLKIPEENFQVENIFGYNWNYRKKRSENFLASKSYRLKLENLDKMNELLEQLDEKGIQRVNVTHYSHTKIETHRKELKLKALVAAKEKAGYLLSGIGEELGGVLEVSEVALGPPVTYKAARAYSNLALEYDAGEEQAPLNIDFKTIKLRFTINAVFAIK
ncbi:MAG: SIMPL domain-containing protein [Cytophagales bacterium]|nr:SIMPL domain-containing protein [Cytophagales bacterium]